MGEGGTPLYNAPHLSLRTAVWERESNDACKGKDVDQIIHGYHLLVDMQRCYTTLRGAPRGNVSTEKWKRLGYTEERNVTFLKG